MGEGRKTTRRLGREQLVFIFSRDFASRSRALRARISRAPGSTKPPYLATKTAMLRRLLLSIHASKGQTYFFPGTELKLYISLQELTQPTNFPNDSSAPLKWCISLYSFSRYQHSFYRLSQVCGRIHSRLPLHRYQN